MGFPDSNPGAPSEPSVSSWHGSAQALAPGVQERLAREYPGDRATGYAVGDIRGAITIKRPLQHSRADLPIR